MKIDGKEVRNFLFARMSRQSPHPELAQVEAHDKDHAVKRLAELYPQYSVMEWDFVEELDAEHDVGMLGRKHPLGVIFRPTPKGVLAIRIPYADYVKRMRRRVH